MKLERGEEHMVQYFGRCSVAKCQEGRQDQGINGLKHLSHFFENENINTSTNVG